MFDFYSVSLCLNWKRKFSKVTELGVENKPFQYDSACVFISFSFHDAWFDIKKSEFIAAYHLSN